MAETKAGGRTKKDISFAGLSEKQKARKKKIQASNEHAYTLEEVARCWIDSMSLLEQFAQSQHSRV